MSTSTNTNAGAAAGYEFTPEQELVVGGLAQAMKVVAVLLVLLGILNGIRAGSLVMRPAWTFPQVSTAGLNCAFQLAIGVYTALAAGSLRAIVDTRQRDLEHLMSALGSARALFRLQLGLLALSVALVALDVLAGVPSV